MTTRRWRVDLATIGAGVLTLLVCGAIARGPLSSLEIAAFRWANDLPNELFTVVWPAMQYGTFITIPLVALVAFVFRRWRLGIALLAAGLSVYGIAIVTKSIVDRGRPGSLLEEVTSHESFGEGSLGFPSGHAAVAAALTVVAFAYLPRRWAIVALGAAVIVFFGRMYVGAHLPLDLVGGAALGAIAGGTANLIVGVPSRPSSRAEAAA